MAIKEFLVDAGLKAGQILGRTGRWEDATREFKRVVEMTNSDDARTCYLYANSLFQLKSYTEALHWTQRAVELDDSNARWHVRLGALYERFKRHSEAADSYRRATELDPQVVEWLLRLARAYNNSKQFDAAKQTLSTAVHLRPDDKEIATEFVEAALKNSPTWQRIEALESAVSHDPTVSKWHAQLGREYRSLGQYKKSVAQHSKAYAAGAQELSNLVGLSLSAKLAHDSESEKYALENISKLSTNSDDAKQIVGDYFYKKGDWINAFSYLSTTPVDYTARADVLYRTGLSADRCHRWEDSAWWLRKAVVASPEKSQWHFRLGLSMERQQRFREAKEAYLAACRFDSKKQAFWMFRAGFCALKEGKVDESINSFLQSVSGQEELVHHVTGLENQDPEDYEATLYENNLKVLIAKNDVSMLHTRGVKMLRKGHFRLAYRFLSEACARSNSQEDTWYFHKAIAAIMLDKSEEAVQAFLNTRVFRRADGISSEQYLKHKWRRDLMEYSEYVETLPVAPDTVLYESYFGGQVACNPLALFDFYSKSPTHSHLKHYWVVTEETEVPDRVRTNPNVIFVMRGSRLYLRMLATAHYLVNNVTFPHYFTRRESQRYLNTWHGTPLKTLGKDIQTGFMEHANVSRNFIQATHILAPNEHTENILIDQYDVRGLFTGQVLRTGTPRIDEVLDSTKNDADLRAALQIPENNRVIFYAPTWRGSLNSKHFDTDALVSTLEALNGFEDVTLLFRAHHMTEKLLTGLDLDTKVVPPTISSNEAMRLSDVLITDYSSIFFDYLALNRPIIFHVPDLEDYKDERGLYFDIATMPGYISESVVDLQEKVAAALSFGIADTKIHERAIVRFAPHEDGRSAERTGLAFFDDSELVSSDPAISNKKLILFHQSLLPNGITSAFINLLNAIDPNEFRVVFLFDPTPFAHEPLRMDKFKQLPEYVQKIARVGAHLCTLEERWVIDKFNAWNMWGSLEQEEIYRSGFDREYRRLLGDVKFDAVVEFDGYSPFWSALLGANPLNEKRIAYMHNRLFAEWSTKYPELAGTMRINRWYDVLLSVSEATNRINMDELGPIFDIDSDRFQATNNLINMSEILDLSLKPLEEDLHGFIEDSPEIWLSIGRMSPEKGHLKLFQAFQKHLDSSPDAKLVLLGDGPLRSELDAFVLKNNLQDSILLAGQRSNPFPLMKRCDGFVLASDHEGQPMVLLEALALGKRVLATDIVGNRGVLAPNFGLLVDNSMQGLAEGMRDIWTEFHPSPFDVDDYCAQALKEALSHFLK